LEKIVISSNSARGAIYIKILSYGVRHVGEQQGVAVWRGFGGGLDAEAQLSCPFRKIDPAWIRVVR
jgi:hypothetical protein